MQTRNHVRAATDPNLTSRVNAKTGGWTRGQDVLIGVRFASTDEHRGGGHRKWRYNERTCLVLDAEEQLNPNVRPGTLYGFYNVSDHKTQSNIRQSTERLIPHIRQAEEHEKGVKSKEEKKSSGRTR